MATYYVAMNKKEETLMSLEKMLQLIEKEGENCYGKLPHNMAWYFMPYLDQERYDPVRKEKRFVAVKKKLASLAK